VSSLVRRCYILVGIAGLPKLERLPFGQSFSASLAFSCLTDCLDDSATFTIPLCLASLRLDAGRLDFPSRFRLVGFPKDYMVRAASHRAVASPACARRQRMEEHPVMSGLPCITITQATSCRTPAWQSERHCRTESAKIWPGSSLVTSSRLISFMFPMFIHPPLLAGASPS
jgi:hypothetical protein